jgi:hypothetical protein
LAEPASSSLDLTLDRLSKIAGILVPLVIGAVGGYYTWEKDKSDQANLQSQQKRDEDQRTFDNAQKQYSNLAALLPLLTSDKANQVKMGLEVYIAETKVSQAPTELQLSILQLSNQFPDQAALVQRAADAGREQQKTQCTANPDGLYIQVANSTEQLDRGKSLAQGLVNHVAWPVQGVQRIDQGPPVTQLRYYYSPDNDARATSIVNALANVGIAPVQKQDLTQRYLKSGCPPPHVFELWMGTSTPLASQNLSR